MGTYLPPIEQPHGLIQKIAYTMSKKRFGKVPTPVKVVAETAFLIREQVAHINVCEFCMDIGRYCVVKASMNEAKFDALADYRKSPLFSEAERAALD
jgi:alkylhydroperoxidase family enzyme